MSSRVAARAGGDGEPEHLEATEDVRRGRYAEAGSPGAATAAGRTPRTTSRRPKRITAIMRRRHASAFRNYIRWNRAADGEQPSYIDAAAADGEQPSYIDAAAADSIRRPPGALVPRRAGCFPWLFWSDNDEATLDPGRPIVQTTTAADCSEQSGDADTAGDRRDAREAGVSATS
jgi:hypothetical protein